MKHTTFIAFSGTLLSLASVAPAQVTATFEFITDTNTKIAAASANDISPDGQWIVGSLDSDGDLFGDIGYRWDRVNNQFTIIDNGGGAFVEAAVAVSDDGSVVLGDLPGKTDIYETIAAIWTDADGWTELGFLPNAGACPSRSNGYELSGDGTIAVGLSWDGCSGRGYRWTQESGMQELENLAFGANRASIMSSDGSVIAGFAQGVFGRTPVTWNGMTLAGTLLDPAAESQGEFLGISDDGSTVLGSWYFGDADGVFDAAMLSDGVIAKIGAGSLLPGWAGTPMDIADNGTIVGFDRLFGNRRAWIQPKGEGELVELVSWLNAHGANVPAGTELQVTQAISADGRYIIGHGAATGAWLVTIDWGNDCPADLTEDGSLNFLDVSAYLTAFGNQDPIADFEADGSFNFLDVSAFLAAFGAGCP
ncbi:MAG: GC-type dockerin domain-anchored protein [Phycisphaerales bacterium]|nr:GC-type dockerin domain-anchored protein [Phycisphaerales bacterium]